MTVCVDRLDDSNNIIFQQINGQININFNTYIPGVVVEPNNPVEGAGVVDPNRPPAAIFDIRDKFRYRY